MTGAISEVQDSISDLPEDVLSLIFLQVNAEDGNEALLCGEVCKQWNRALKPAITTLTLSIHSNPVLALGKVASFQNLRCLRIERCTFGLRGWAFGFEAVGKGCPYLSALHISELGFRGSQGMVSDDVTSLLNNCCNLRVLEMRASLSSAHLPPLVTLTRLETLDVSNNFWLKTLPPLAHLTTLKSLNLAQCRHLESLPPLLNLPSLQTLDISFCTSFTEPPSLRGLPSLASLKASGSPWLRHLSVAELPALRHLDLRGCEHLCQVDGLEHATAMQSLSFPQLEQHQSCLPPLSSLHTLEISLHDAEADLRWITTLTALKELTITSFRSCALPPHALPLLQKLVLLHATFRKIPDLEALRKLRTVQILNCDEIQSADALLTMPGLSHLHISHCPRLLTLPHHLPNLVDLSLAHCERLVRIPSFASPSPLTQLILLRCDALRQMPPLGALSHLHNLRIVGCIALAALPPLSHLPSLLSLTVSSCRSLHEPPSLPSSLRSLTFKRCMALGALPSLLGLTHLQVVDIDECRALREVPELKGLTALRELCLTRCKDIPSLPSLTGLVSLRKLDLSGCERITCLPSLDGLVSLRSVVLRGCDGITNVPPCCNHSLDIVLDD